MKSGVERIAAERQRQISAEGWTPEHDDKHDKAELILAAICYAGETKEMLTGLTGYKKPWPWGRSWWKPSPDPIRNLVKAGALIAAEIDRLLRKIPAAPPVAAPQLAPEPTLTERRAEFVYDAARLAAISAQAPIVPVPWRERESAFRDQFLNVIDKQCGPNRSHSPEELHGTWVEAYEKMGWKFGEKYDRESKIHPDMVPYAELGQLERDKDAVFVALCEIARQWIYDLAASASPSSAPPEKIEKGDSHENATSQTEQRVTKHPEDSTGRRDLQPQATDLDAPQNKGEAPRGRERSDLGYGLGK